MSTNFIDRYNKYQAKKTNLSKPVSNTPKNKAEKTSFIDRYNRRQKEKESQSRGTNYQSQCGDRGISDLGNVSIAVPTDPYAKYYGMSSGDLQSEKERLEREGAVYTTRAATNDEIAIEAGRLDKAWSAADSAWLDADAMYQSGSMPEYYTADYVAGLKAERDAITAERDAFYSGLRTTGGWSVTEVTGNKYQDEIDWLTGYIPSADKVLEYSEQYLPYTSAPDYAEKSMYVSTANGQEQYSPVSNMYTNTGFNDAVYDYINGNETARDVLMLNSISDNTAFLGLDKSFLNEMKEHEVALFNYIYATESPAAAYEYIDFISGDLTARQRINESTRWSKYAKEHPHIADMTSIMMSPLKGLSYLGQVVDYVNDGKIDANAGYNKFSYIPSVIREERGEQVNKNWGKLGDVGEFGYNLAMGMGDFAMNTIVSGGYSPIATLLMGGGAAADTTLAAKDRGLSDDQAIILGTVAGAVEAATEKISIETLLDPDLAADGFLKYVWKNMVTEGSEEGASNLINSFADILISGNQSQWAQSVEYYKSQGYSDAAARERALGDQARSLGLDVLGGMLTGGFLSGGYGAVNFASSRGDSRIARDNGNAVPTAQSNTIQSLTAVAHTPLEKRALSQYKSAVELLENRQRILANTQQQLQQLATTGDIRSEAYTKLKSAELELKRKVNEAQRKVERLEESTSVSELREKAKNNQANKLEKSNAAQYNNNKITVDGITAPGISQELDYDRKTRKWTQFEDLQAVNPKFSQSIEYRLNCQRCVPAYELRRRGYRVASKPAAVSIDGKLSKEDALVKNNTWFSGLFKDIQWMSGGRDNGIEQIKKMLSKWGSGARAEVYVQWINGGSHVFVAENVNGKVMFIDPQSGNGDYEMSFERVKSGRTLFARIDNLELTDAIKECVYNGG